MLKVEVDKLDYCEEIILPLELPAQHFLYRYVTIGIVIPLMVKIGFDGDGIILVDIKTVQSDETEHRYRSYQFHHNCSTGIYIYMM